MAADYKAIREEEVARYKLATNNSLDSKTKTWKGLWNWGLVGAVVGHFTKSEARKKRDHNAEASGALKAYNASVNNKEDTETRARLKGELAEAQYIRDNYSKRLGGNDKMSWLELVGVAVALALFFATGIGIAAAFAIGASIPLAGYGLDLAQDSALSSEAKERGRKASNTLIAEDERRAEAKREAEEKRERQRQEREEQRQRRREEWEERNQPSHQEQEDERRREREESGRGRGA